MSSREGPNRLTGNDEREEPSGPNLALLYSLIALGLLVALGLAALVVLPFYQHRH